MVATCFPQHRWPTLSDQRAGVHQGLSASHFGANPPLREGVPPAECGARPAATIPGAHCCLRYGLQRFINAPHICMYHNAIDCTPFYHTAIMLMSYRRCILFGCSGGPQSPPPKGGIRSEVLPRAGHLSEKGTRQ